MNKALLLESNIGKKEDDQHQTKGYQSPGISVKNIKFFLIHKLLLIKIAINRLTIVYHVLSILSPLSLLCRREFINTLLHGSPIRSGMTELFFHQKTALAAAHLVHLADSLTGWIDNLTHNITPKGNYVKQQSCVDPPGVEPGKLGLSIQLSEPAGPTRATVYHVLSILFLLCTFHFTLFTLPGTVSAQTSTTSAEVNYQPINVNSITPQSPIYANLMVNNLIHAFSCIMAGTSPIGQPCVDYLNGVPVISKADTSSGLLGVVVNMNALVLANPPIRTGQYLATLGDSLGITKEANAQVAGTGAGVLTPIIRLWQVSRNISYVAMIIIFVIIGLMVMFRQRINPQTVITAQAALPGLIIGLILITFSYFFASLLTDTAYIATNLVGYYFQAAQDGGDLNVNLSQRVADESVLTTFGYFTGSISSGQFTDAVEAVFTRMPPATQAWLRAAAGLVAYQFGSGAGGNIDIPGLGFILGLAAALPAAAAPAQVAGQVLYFIAMGALIYQMLKLLLKLVTNFLQIIFLTITAPFHFLAASLPGRQGIAIDWMRNMLCNILAFPAVLAVMYFISYILGPGYGLSGVFDIFSRASITGVTDNITLPLLGGLDLRFIQILLAYAALLATPKVPDIICEAIGKVGRAGAMIEQEISAANRAGQGYAQRGTQGAGQVIGGGLGSFDQKGFQWDGTKWVRKGVIGKPGIWTRFAHPELFRP